MSVNKTTLHVMGIMATAGLCGTIYIVVKHKRRDQFAVKILEELNKILSPTSKGLSGEEAFDIQYADEITKKVKGVLWLKSEQANKYAKQIYGAWGVMDDDEDAVYNVFRSMKDKVQVSQVSKAYATAYKTNLIDTLRNNLSETEISQVLQIIRPLPRYRVNSLTTK